MSAAGVAIRAVVVVVAVNHRGLALLQAILVLHTGGQRMDGCCGLLLCHHGDATPWLAHLLAQHLGQAASVALWAAMGFVGAAYGLKTRIKAKRVEKRKPNFLSLSNLAC